MQVQESVAPCAAIECLCNDEASHGLMDDLTRSRRFGRLAMLLGGCIMYFPVTLEYCTHFLTADSSTPSDLNKCKSYF